MGDMPDIAGEIAAAYNRHPARGTRFERVDGVETLTQVKPAFRTSRLPNSRAAKSARRNLRKSMRK